MVAFPIGLISLLSSTDISFASHRITIIFMSRTAFPIFGVFGSLVTERGMYQFKTVEIRFLAKSQPWMEIIFACSY